MDEKTPVKEAEEWAQLWRKPGVDGGGLEAEAEGGETRKRHQDGKRAQMANLVIIMSVK